MSRRILQKIATFAQKYDAEILSQWGERRDEYLKHWFAAFDFFLGHVYYQGRRDALSTQYYQSAAEALRSYFGTGDNPQRSRLQEAWGRRWIPQDRAWKVYASTANPISSALALAKAGKRRDQEMVIDALRYVHGLAKHNIVTHSIREIEAGRLLAHHAELQTIFQIGPKTSSFYLRDLCTLYKLEPDAQSAEALQPIDTWVQQICGEVGIAIAGDDVPTVRRKLLAACRSAGVSASGFNAGAWYLGTHSLQIAIEHLGKGGRGAAG